MLFQSRSICDRNTSIGAKNYENEAVNRSYFRFRDRWELVEGVKRCGRPKSTRNVNIVDVADLVKSDRQIT